MYREAVYTLGGSCVPLPSTLAKFVKMLGVRLCILKTTELIFIIPLTPFSVLARFLSAQSSPTYSSRGNQGTLRQEIFKISEAGEHEKMLERKAREE